MTTQLPNGLTTAQADKLARGIQPSWHDFFGAPAVSLELPAIAPERKVAKTKPGAPIAPAGKAQPAGKADAGQRTGSKHRNKMHAPDRGASGRRDRAAAKMAHPAQAMPVDLPTSGPNWGLIAGGVLGVAAVIGLVFAFGGSDEETGAAKSKPVAAQPKPKAAAKPIDPKPAAKPAVAPSEPTKAEPEPAEPEPAEPEPAEPEPAEPEPAEPEPVATQPDPPPRVVPKTPSPRPRPFPKPKSKPKSGGIVRDAPF